MLYTGRYEVAGHAAGHLSSGTFVFLATAIAAVLLWTTPAARRSPIVLGGLSIWLGAGVAIAIGNARVIDALIATGQATTATGRIVESPALNDAHWLANTAPLVAVAGAFIVLLGIYLVRAASIPLAIAAAVLNILIPPWVVPGFGLIVVAIARVIAREKAARQRGATRSEATPRSPAADP
ncbi:MAG TPA: hypothetical protein VMY88_12620 [Acidimicrobiales bacterium]|nr:hypothetical protein [Acidimicrobiales bacterium]